MTRNLSPLEAAFTPIGQKAALHYQAAEQIGISIVTGRIGVGEWLPNEATLAAQLGIARTTLRTALVVLDEKRLVAIVHGKGSRAAAAHSWDLLDVDVLRWMAHARTLPSDRLAPQAAQLLKDAEQFALLAEKIAPQAPENPLLISLLRRLRPLAAARTHGEA